MTIGLVAPRVRKAENVAVLGLVCVVVACATVHDAHNGRQPALGSGRDARSDTAALTGTWELVSVTTLWPDGHLTEPWGATRSAD
jgi:hypothetical protein